MSGATHPARSLEFLSRLHDGELSPAERAHFESHRAHCSECRRAAAEFEEALASYRTAGTSPAPSDLAARILRRLEKANPRRSPFGVFFGIDLKWAGAFAAAIIAVILGYSVMDRPERSRQIRISFAAPTPAASAPMPAAPPGRPVTPRAAPRQREALRESKAEPPPKSAEEPAPASAPQAGVGRSDEAATSSAAERRETFADARDTPPQSRAAQQSDARTKSYRSLAASQDRDAAEVQGLLSATPAPIGLKVTALDGNATAPAILNAGQLPLSGEHRGEYILVVGANGVPLEVFHSEKGVAKANDPVGKSAGDILRKLRFEVGGRPRRLLVRIE